MTYDSYFSDDSKCYLVTGGAGFLGSHLCRELLSASYEVICVDDFSTGFQHNISDLFDHPGFVLVQHDICEPFEITCDGIFHLASPASPIHYQLDPIRTTRVNVEGTYNVLELARKEGIPVLLASTSEVYGDPEQHPQREDYVGHVNPIGPRSCYDEGKRCAESLAFSYHRRHGVPIRVARFFNTYGPQMHPLDGRVVSNFILQALSGLPITVFGDGSQTRSFCYVSDLVGALPLMMELPGPCVGPMNLGNPDERTIKELAELITQLVGVSSSVEYSSLPVDDPKQRCPDITLAQDLLGWSPQVDLRTGLLKTIEYFRHCVDSGLMPRR